MQSFKKHLEEKLKASDDMGTWVKDFQDSDAPQFKGKSQKKRQQMAVAAKLSAERNEEVELDEARKSTSYQFTHKPGDAESEKKLADLKKSVKGTGKRVVLQGRLGKDNPNAHKYSKAMQGKPGSASSGAHTHQRIKKADAAHHDVYVYDRHESVDLDEQTQYDLVETYLLENNIDVDTLSVEQLDEIIGKVIGGAFKVGAKAAVGAARGVKKAANRMSTAGRADAAEKKADAAEKRNKDRERIEKARNRLRDAQNAARDNQTQN